jgi:hypothetical protein
VTWAIPALAFNVADVLLVVGCASLFLVRSGDRRRARSGLADVPRAAA